MYCPKCKAQYNEGINKCPKCKVSLVNVLPGENRNSKDTEWVTVLETGDKIQIAILKSLLEDAGTPYIVTGEELQDIFALGSLGTGFNPLIGPMQLLVGKEDEEDIRKLIEITAEETQWTDEKIRVEDEVEEEQTYHRNI